MSPPEKPDIPGWFGLRQPWLLTIARPLGPLLSVVVILLFALAVTAAGAILLHAIFDLGLGTPRTGFGTGAVIVALLGAPFVVWRAVVAQRQADIAQEGLITDRINTAVQGLGAEKEVSAIGRPVTLHDDDPALEASHFPEVDRNRTVIEWQEKPLHIPQGMFVRLEGDWQVFTETVPNLEVRIGAIYALERIAQDSDRDHVQIMEILCAYIRQNAPAPQTDDWPPLEMKAGEDKGPLEADWEKRLKSFREAQEEARAKLKLREDIQVALEVIGRRWPQQRLLEARAGDAPDDAEFVFDADYPEHDGPDDAHDPEALKTFLAAKRKWQEAAWGYEGYRLDLRGADLRGTDLSRLNLNGAKLDDTHLQGADLWEARLQGAGLRKARLQGARLRKARLQGAFLWEARLQGTRLWEARLQGADLGRARFDPETDLAAATLRGAAAMSVDFTSIPEVADHLEGMFGDGSVTLPGGRGPDGGDWPGHWPRHKLDPAEFYEEWRKWRDDPDNYDPPDPPAEAGG